MLRAEHIAIGYSKKTILSDLNFSADSGERIALLGLNGTGKSTLLRTLAGLLRVKSGSVKLAGEDINVLRSDERARRLAVVTTERMKTGNMTAFEVVSMGRYPYTGIFGRLNAADEEAIRASLETCGVLDLQEQFFAELSDGQKQRTLIARALAQETPVILLDEPTSFLDVRGKAEVFDLLRKLPEKLILFSTHEVERAMEVASRCWVIDEDGGFHDLPVSSGQERANIRAKLGLNGI